MSADRPSWKQALTDQTKKVASVGTTTYGGISESLTQTEAWQQTEDLLGVVADVLVHQQELIRDLERRIETLEGGT